MRNSLPLKEAQEVIEHMQRQARQLRIAIVRHIARVPRLREHEHAAHHTPLCVP